ncbi:MAG: ribulose-phosphate 3-epimerase [Synergistaceae bacterium]|jgi:ribulose-phosphate 3-epimerase|nr:ribulose-phosphate 3-epimerase [Synergistaceae bacterium]
MLDIKGGRACILAPSILSADTLAIGESIRSLGSEGDWIHVDVADGHFVPNLTFGPMMVSALRRGFPDAFIDVHLMVTPAEDFIGMFMPTGPDIITVQVEAARHVHRTLQAIRDAGIIPGVSINPGTPVCMLEPVLHMVGLVLVMTVNPGFGGQKFIPEVLSKIKRLVRERAVQSLDFLIECDGGVNSETAGVLVNAGCDVLVAGSAVYDSDDPARAAREIRRNAELEWRV